MHVVHHQTTDCRDHSKIPGMAAMVPAATVILVTRSSSVSTTVSFNQLLHVLPEEEIQTREVR